MPSYQPQPAALEPIETASTDQLRALQQVRLRDTLRRRTQEWPTTGPHSTPRPCTPTHPLGGWCGGGSCAWSVPLWPGFQLLRMALLSR
jgi:hypothetical protein